MANVNSIVETPYTDDTQLSLNQGSIVNDRPTEELIHENKQCKKVGEIRQECEIYIDRRLPSF